MKATKGTPRKRPYDVKRKLVRSAVKYKLCDGSFGEPNEATCIIGAFAREHGIQADNNRGRGAIVADVAPLLGLTVKEVWDIIGGFDKAYMRGYGPWVDVGLDLREALL